MKDISKDIASMEATLLALKQLLEDLVKGARTAKEAASLTDAFELSLEAIDELLPDWDDVERKGSPEEQDNLEYQISPGALQCGTDCQLEISIRKSLSERCSTQLGKIYGVEINKTS